MHRNIEMPDGMLIAYDKFVASKCKPMSLRDHLNHMCLGIAGEAGELIDPIKKHTIYGKPLDKENVIEEIGDLLFYVQGIINELDLDYNQILQQNADKLNKRYKDGYSDKAAQERADKQPKVIYQIEQWSLAPGYRLRGQVYGNPQFTDGEVITTSRIMIPDIDGIKLHEGDIINTRNSTYQLGTPFKG